MSVQPESKTIGQQLGRTGLVTVLLVVLIMLTVPLVVYAKLRSSGAGGCGNFIDAVNGAAEGDTIAQMNPEKDTSGAVIARALWIQGGWLPSEEGCDEANQEFETFEDMIAAGFTYDPSTRADLVHDGAPVLTLDITSSRVFTIENISLAQLSLDVGAGGGLLADVRDGSELILKNVMFDGNQSTANGRGAGMAVRLWGGSRLTIVDSTFKDNTAMVGAGLDVEAMEPGSQVTIQGSEFQGNQTTDGHGGGGRIRFYGPGSLTVRDNLFANNVSSRDGSALAVRTFGNGPVFFCHEDNTFYGNSPDPSGFYVPDNATLEGCDRLYLPLMTSSNGY